MDEGVLLLSRRSVGGDCLGLQSSTKAPSSALTGTFSPEAGEKETQDAAPASTGAPGSGTFSPEAGEKGWGDGDLR